MLHDLDEAREWEQCVPCVGYVMLICHAMYIAAVGMGEEPRTLAPFSYQLLWIIVTVASIHFPLHERRQRWLRKQLNTH